MAYTCDVCGASFPKLNLLLQHRRVQNHNKKYTCECCKKIFNRKDNLERHLKRHNDENNHHCPECLAVFSREDALDEHLHQQHGWPQTRQSGVDQEGGGPSKKRKLNEQDDPSQFYNIEKINERRIEKFKTSATYYKVHFNDIEKTELSNILKTLKMIFHSLIQNITEGMSAGDLIRLSIDNPQLDYPIGLRFMPKSDLTVDRLLSEIERVLQSYEQFVLDETLGIEVVHVHMPTGRGFKRKGFVDIQRLMNNKRSIIQIQNNDELCCARAIITAIAHIEKNQQWNSIRVGRSIQRQLAEELHQRAGVSLRIFGLEEVKKFQSVLPDFQIHVISKEHFNSIIYEGPQGGTPIYLYHHDDHFDVITKMTGFLNRSYFCNTCKKGYSNKERHSCNDPCVYCHHLHEQDSEEWRYCSSCRRYFKGDACYNMHLKQSESGKSTCNRYYKCKECGQTINMDKHKKLHVCHEVYCKTCKDFCEDGHQCFMQPVEAGETSSQQLKQKKEVVPTTYIFFDLECTQEHRVECENGYERGKNGKCVHCKKSLCGSLEHRANLCIAQKVCPDCMESSDVLTESSCIRCDRNQRIFAGKEAVTSFCRWLFSEQNVGATVISHNFRGYDSYPILNYLHDNAILPDVITNGSKYMSITVPACKIRFIVSLNFMPMSLADMPKAFGETELAKGFFPHLFNRQDNQHMVLDHLPDAKYYNPDGMKPKIREEFLTWYTAHKNDSFDFQNELVRYCQSDVDILRRCVLKFRKLFKELTAIDEQSQGIDPFERCITIASACNLVFRSIFLDYETIAIIPPHGYRPQAKQSVIAYQWLAYVSHKKNINIQHGRNSGEKDIGPYKVDGYYESEGVKYVLEFHGCFWHGCPKCYSASTLNPVCDMTMGDLYETTMDKKRYIEEQGYTYICKWECEFKKEIEHDTHCRRYIDDLEIVTPLEPRDSFYGGRTEGFKLYEEEDKEKQIKYYDVTSLYPWVNKTGKIPMGHPEIITGNFKNIEEYEGLVKCKVLPPRDLYIPVLPAKFNGKLMFSLCRTCSETYQKSKCQHDNHERSITGTWVTDELKMAVSQGYTILKMHEVWHFPSISQYDPVIKTGWLFTQYVHTFLKVKQQASGFPSWATTEDLKQQYIRQYNEREGIVLEYDKIEDNPGLRSLAKLMLNSFWRKFGQRSNLTKTTYTDDPVLFMDMLTSDQQDIKNVRFVNAGGLGVQQ